jgi:hypothetical protein
VWVLLTILACGFVFLLFVRCFLALLLPAVREFAKARRSMR